MTGSMTKSDDSTLGGLPNDAGNGMSERAGYTDESESGMTETPTATGGPTHTRDADGAVPQQPGQSDSAASTGTSFGSTPGDDKRL
jgi:hypothetical protein